MKTTLSVILALVLVAGGYLLYARHNKDNPSTNTVTTTTTGSTQTTGTGNTASTTGGSVVTTDIKITTPKSGQLISSPFTITGQARGNWFFEATAPVYLADGNGKKIAEGHITAQGDWMTTNFVPFSATLSWTASSTGTSTKAFVVFMNDNPSGNPSLQKSVTVPVLLR